MAEDPLGVVITAREIYDEIVGMRDDIRSQAQASADVDKTIEDHEKRIRAVERWKYSLPIAALTGVVGAATALYSGGK